MSVTATSTAASATILPFAESAAKITRDVRPLRLITCGGAFDEAVGHYRDNVVVFARIA